jgi:hypothetical protein
MPKAGFTNPRFKNVGPQKVAVPQGGYKSIIDAAPPLDAGKMGRIAAVTAPRSINKTGGGDRSRAAFGRALTDTSRNTLNKASDTFNTEYQKQAEKSRAEDILTQRQNQTDRFRMDVYNAIFGEDTRTRFVEGIKDGSQNFETEKRNEQAKRTAIMLSFLGSLI